MLSLKKKSLFKTKMRKHDKLHFKLFPCFCFRLLWVWFVFLDSVSLLRINFVFFLSVFPVGDGYFRFGICVSVFWYCVSVLGFRFVLCVAVLGWFFPIFVVVVVLWFFCFYRPPYIFDSPLHLNPTTGEHFKTPLKISSQRSNRPGKK